MDRALEAAESIYRRSLALIDHAADASRTPTLIAWQPGGPPPRPLDRDLYGELTDRVAGVGGAVDLSGALRSVATPVYIDAVHTNELGARVVAEALWAQVAPLVGSRDGG